MWKIILFAVTSLFVGAMLYLPTAQAGVISTSDYLQQEEVADVRTELLADLQREEVRDRLVEMGVDPAGVEARVAALSDTEVMELASDMDAMPAGAAGGTTLIILIILLILLI